MKISGATIVVAYLGVLAVIGLQPQRLDGNSLGVYRLLYRMYAIGGPRWVTYDVVEFIANIALMVPLGVGLALLLPPRRWWIAVVACSLLSVGFELAQLFLPSRMPSVTDWISNSLGGLAGAGGVAAIRASLRRKSAGIT